MNQTLPPAKDQEPGDPEWLRQMRGWEDTPDWLRKLIRSGKQAAGPAAPGSPAVRAPDASADLPDAAAPDVAVPDAGAPDLDDYALPLAQEDEVDWLVDMDAQESSVAEDDDIPDWLRRMSPTAGLNGAEPPATAEPEAAPDAAGGISFPAEAEQDVPDWLRDLSPAGEAAAEDELEAPDWLSELDQAAPASHLIDRSGRVRRPLSDVAPARDRGGDGGERPVEDAVEPAAPDWLLDLAEEPEPAREGDIAPVLPPDQGLAERLRGVEEVRPAPAADAEPEIEAPGQAEPDLEALPSGEAEFPAWLTEMAEQELAEGEDLLAEPVEGEPAGALALPTVEDIVGDVAPAPADTVHPAEPLPPEEEALAEDQVEGAEWLYAVGEEPSPQEPILYFGEGELLREEMPEWVDELRIAEPETGAIDAVVETSGPLAGLSGLLSPDPLFGLTYRADYVALSPVPDAQQEQARLLRSFLATPSKRPDVAPLRAGRATLARLGRWVIYGALLAAICAGIFASFLQALIQPSQTVEAQAFYDVVSGLPRGSEVLLVVDYDASHDGELTPQTRAILWHLLNREQGVLIVSHTPQGAAIVEDLVRADLGGAWGTAYVAGQHYLHVGYMPPHAALLQAFMANPLGGATLWGASPADAAQTPLGQRVARFEDLDLILVVSSRQEHVRWWVEQTALGGRRAGIVAGVSASAAPHLLPYYAAPYDTYDATAYDAAAEGRGIAGLLIGLSGAAEYEQLTGAQFWPSARENVILLGCAQLMLAAIVLASGIRSLLGRSKGA